MAFLKLGSDAYKMDEMEPEEIWGLGNGRGVCGGPAHRPSGSRRRVAL